MTGIFQSPVSGADYIATTIGGFTLAQLTAAKLPKFFTTTANQNISVTYGALSLRLASSGGVSLEFAFDHSGFATAISKTTSSVNSSSYRYNFAYDANVFQKAHLALNINDAGAMQEATITDVTANKIYVCVMLVGAGGAGNFFSISQVK